MRLLMFLSLVIVGYIVWKIVKVVRLMRNPADRGPQPRVDLPPDQAYKNIEDADFEDISRDPDKTS
jgi:hypothetical protein